MWNVVSGNEQKIKEMNDLWNEVVLEDGFYKPIPFENYQAYLENIPGFSYDGIALVYDGELLVGMGIAAQYAKYGDGSINAIIVRPKYRDQKIGDTIITYLENYLLDKGCKSVSVGGFLPSCYAWYIPNTAHHDHPCAPGVRINSSEYFFLLHRGYNVLGIQDAFHLNLSDYEISDKIEQIIKENEKDGLTIEFYDPDKHTGMERFYQDLGIYDFEKVIRENLKLPKPYPFLVVSEKGKIKGWTGALWNEPSGRGHFDGIAILSSIRGRGLGKALFSYLAYHSKLNGATFMTFYTGLTNHARYIYMGAGFKIVQSFAVMKKYLKK